MADIIGFLISISGILILVGMVAAYLNKDSPNLAALRTVNVTLARVSAMLLAVYVMLICYDLSAGLLSFATIGLYIACVSIIYASWKELMGSSAFAANLASVAAHRVGQAQNDLAMRAAKINEEARRLNERGDRTIDQ